MSCPSSLQRQDLNSRPLEDESSPITTRPGVPWSLPRTLSCTPEQLALGFSTPLTSALIGAQTMMMAWIRIFFQLGDSRSLFRFFDLFKQQYNFVTMIHLECSAMIQTQNHLDTSLSHNC